MESGAEESKHQARQKVHGSSPYYSLRILACGLGFFTLFTLFTLLAYLNYTLQTPNRSTEPSDFS